jgi:hypothetical protein
MLCSHHLAFVPADFVSARSGPACRLESVNFEIYDATLLSGLILGHSTLTNLSQVWWEGHERRQDEVPGDLAKTVDGHARVSYSRVSYSRVSYSRVLSGSPPGNQSLSDLRSLLCLIFSVLTIHSRHLCCAYGSLSALATSKETIN